MTKPLPPDIRDRVRFAMFSLSAVCYLSWLLPLASDSNAQGTQLPVMPLRAVADKDERVLPLIVARDPFAGAPESGAGANAGEATAPKEAEAPLGDRAQALRASDAPAEIADGDVPDIGDAAHTAMQSVHSYMVRATIVGRSAVAYVQDGPNLEIVRVGDRLGNARIVAIDLRGLRFASGARLDLETGFRTPAASSANGSSAMTRAELVHILRSIVARHATPPPAPPAPVAQRQPTSTLSPSYPTPGPLPTVDQRGSSAATRATDVPFAPTPYPVPGIDR